MKTFLFIALLTLAGCETKADKQFNEAIRIGNEAIDIAKSIAAQRDSLIGLVASYRYCDSLNRINHHHGNGIGWYSVNPKK